MDMDKNEIWDKICKKHKNNSMINSSHLLSIDQQSAVIEVPSKFHKEYIESKYHYELKKDIKDIADNDNLKIIYQVKGENANKKNVEHTIKHYYKYIKDWLEQDSTTSEKTKSELIQLFFDENFDIKIKKIREDFGYPANGFKTSKECNNFLLKREIKFADNGDNLNLMNNTLSIRICYLLDDLMLDNNYYLFILLFVRYGFNMFKSAVPAIRESGLNLLNI